MSIDLEHTNKSCVGRLCDAMYDFDESTVRAQLKEALSLECVIHMCHPFGDLNGPIAFYDAVYRDLYQAIPDLERRDYIRVAGPSESDEQWVGCAGYYMGSFKNSWLGLPATGQFISFRYHEFFKIVDEKVIEIQAVWDLPEWLHQINVWPMAPSLGREFQVPGPASNDGVSSQPYDAEHSLKTRQHIIDMLSALVRHPAEGGPEVMELDKFWHPKMNWYGPSGIGTCRGIQGFRQWHQIPFLNAMPDRGQFQDEVELHFFAEGNYAAVTGWPNMAQTLSHDGWLGLPGTGQKIFLRSLDFWRVENGLIRENWVLVDLMHVYSQLGIDVLSRAREIASTRMP